jgi:hypothetical protein
MRANELKDRDFPVPGVAERKRAYAMKVTLSLPSTDTGLLQWSQNVVNLITPTPANWGLVVGDVTTYTALNSSYSTALAACDKPVRNKSAVVAKNAAKLALKNGAAVVANKIYATPTVTDAMKVQIGMPPRANPQPIPAPSSAPGLDVLSVSAWTVSIKLHDSTSSAKRGKPPGVSGASVFSFVGATPPDDIASWKFEGNTGKTKVNVVFPNTVAPGARVWLTAFWFNGRKQSGPACAPVGTIVQGGSVSLAA